MGSFPFFSIIIPTKNPNEIFFNACIESVLKQNYSFYELIIVANGCDIKHLSYIKNIVANNSNVRLIETAVSGVSRARNIGIAQCKGEYIFFLDDDDILNINLLECAQYILSSDVDLVVFRDSRDVAFLTREHFEHYKILEKKDFLPSFFPTCDMERKFETRSIWGKAFKTDIILRHNLKFDENIIIGEDVLFSCSYALLIDRMALSSLTGLYYRKNSLSVLNKYNDKIITNVEDFLSIFKKFIIFNTINDEVYYNYAFNHSLFNIFQSYLYHNDFSSSENSKIKILKSLLKDSVFMEVLKKTKINQIINYKKKFVFVLAKLNCFRLLSFVLSLRYKK